METTMSHGSKGTKLTRMFCAVLLAAASVIAAAGADPVAAAITCAGSAPSDFNGDGISDAAIGEFRFWTTGQGHVHIIYGTRAGLTADQSGTALDDQLLTDNKDIYTGFGAALVTADFNGDHCSDLAVGDPFALDAAGDYAGDVRIYWGSITGLSAGPTIIETQAPGGTQSRDAQFGSVLAAGDFNNDGAADLAVGSTAANPGAVFVFPGHVGSTSFSGAKTFTEGDGVIPGPSESGDLGAALATGDFNGDGRSDLAIGNPFENGLKGEVFVIRGSGTSAMLTSTGAQKWTRGTAGIIGTAVIGDQFGRSLATGSFKGNGRTDLVIGAPFKDVNSMDGAGVFDVIYSAGATGLSSTGTQHWTQSSAGLGNMAQPYSSFGSSFAAGDFNGNGRTDLAVGAWGTPVSGAGLSGEVTILPGSASGLTATGSSRWSQATAGITGTPEVDDDFGFSLGALRVTSSGRDDLLVGIPGESVTANDGEGAAEFIPGSAAGLTVTASEFWSADTVGIKGTACADCGFGAAVR
jgi:FG-GAP repeat